MKVAFFKKRAVKKKTSAALAFIHAFWDRFLHPPISKRQMFVFETLVLTAGLLLTQLVSFEARFEFVIALFVCTYCLSAYSLRDNLSGIEWITLLLPISFFSAGVALFYFLLPVRWLTRIPVATLYAVGIYALLLTNNIYNVAAIRTIALLRAARSVGFLLSVLTFYLFASTIISQQNYAPFNAFFSGLVAFGVGMPLLWSIELTQRLGKKVLHLSIALAVIVAQVCWILSFVPTPPAIIALTLTAVFYSIFGMGVEYLDEKLYKKTVTEFLLVNIFVFLILLLTTRWR